MSPLIPLRPLTAAERARRAMLKDYAAKAGRASQVSWTQPNVSADSIRKFKDRVFA